MRLGGGESKTVRSPRSRRACTGGGTIGCAAVTTKLLSGRSWDWENRLSGWNDGCSDDGRRGSTAVAADQIQNGSPSLWRPPSANLEGIRRPFGAATGTRRLAGPRRDAQDAFGARKASGGLAEFERTPMVVRAGRTRSGCACRSVTANIPQIVAKSFIHCLWRPEGHAQARCRLLSKPIILPLASAPESRHNGAHEQTSGYLQI